MKILVTGGCGYKGSVLIPKLIRSGHNVINFDTAWFGNNIDEYQESTFIKGDIRDTQSIPLQGVDVVVHLANIANDPAVDLNPNMSWEVNVLAGQQLIDKARRFGVKHFIFASSGSVYGIKDEDKVTEDLPLVPISAYNKTKMIAERVFMSYANDMKIHCIRPATVCGLSPRMRLDVAVNLLTFQALSRGEISVFGGSQIRPNIHIDDICDVYIHCIKNSLSIESGCYNAGFENISIKSIAQAIKEKINCEIKILVSNDPRSYRQDSSKLLKTGFTPKKCIANAIDEIANAYEKGLLKDNPEWHTVKWMKDNKIS